MTGASWDVQLVTALTAAGFGALATLPTLLCALKLRPLERFAADFVAAAAVGVLFLLSAETGAQGQLTAYCAVCYFLSLALSRKAMLRCAAFLADRFAPRFAARRIKKGVISPRRDGLRAPSSLQDNPPQAETRTFAFLRGKGGTSVRRRQADESD